MKKCSVGSTSPARSSQNRWIEIGDSEIDSSQEIMNDDILEFEFILIVLAGDISASGRPPNEVSPSPPAIVFNLRIKICRSNGQLLTTPFFATDDNIDSDVSVI